MQQPKLYLSKLYMWRQLHLLKLPVIIPFFKTRIAI